MEDKVNCCNPCAVRLFTDMYERKNRSNFVIFNWGGFLYGE